jgi:predicted PhzF superfamily epimerase YddE/YHI9
MTSIFQVDAFTDIAYRGNPAGVCPVDEFPADEWMQAVAAEMNVAETAFVTPADREGQRGLRWFSPTTEVPLCGHATLATAHVLWSEGYAERDAPLAFSTRSGVLTASPIAGGWIELDLPAMPAADSQLPDGVLTALGVSALRTGTSEIFDVVEVSSPSEVAAAAPDMAVLRGYPRCYIVTARSDGDEVLCRVFAPAIGIDEDPATGSAQCVLAPWWAPSLGADRFVVRQLSRRGGTLRVRLDGDRVGVAGQAVTTLRGSLV